MYLRNVDGHQDFRECSKLVWADDACEGAVLHQSGSKERGRGGDKRGTGREERETSSKEWETSSEERGLQLSSKTTLHPLKPDSGFAHSLQDDVKVRASLHAAKVLDNVPVVQAL